ncbi:MAG TPA: hypothetical protein PL078_09865, partial [Bacillota bacterium]|jgi:hypothetical protein|nr:hypothetical protein [Peptococcaceae bacterium]HPZ44293.1 hypothetical protein [Bacillota bacterium]HQD76889.1 hypothetical protein [Bacillota bacterium]HUM59544.1 hypothetical protein [Bacillota bacterium]
MGQLLECNINIKITIPKGILYYPCCWDDTIVPIRIFLNKVNQFHFADIHRIGLPALGEGHERGRRPTTTVFKDGEFCKGRRGNLIIRPWSVSKSKVCNLNINQETISFARTLSENVILIKNPGIYKEIWTNLRDGSKAEVFCHYNDGILTLSSLEKLSIFFYRGDSIGEGGSGQWWLGPKLFNYLLDKLLDGGLIITDGSNPDPMYKTVAWSPLWEYGNDFTYRNRHFKCLGKLDSSFRSSTYVWQVKMI